MSANTPQTWGQKWVFSPPREGAGSCLRQALASDRELQFPFWFRSDRASQGHVSAKAALQASANTPYLFNFPVGNLYRKGNPARSPRGHPAESRPSGTPGTGHPPDVLSPVALCIVCTLLRRGCRGGATSRQLTTGQRRCLAAALLNFQRPSWNNLLLKVESFPPDKTSACDASVHRWPAAVAGGDTITGISCLSPNAFPISPRRGSPHFSSLSGRAGGLGAGGQVRGGAL